MRADIRQEVREGTLYLKEVVGYIQETIAIDPRQAAVDFQIWLFKAKGMFWWHYEHATGEEAERVNQLVAWIVNWDLFAAELLVPLAQRLFV